MCCRVIVVLISILFLGIYTEFIGFLIVFGCGLILGIILSPFGNSLGFPTFQMADRGTPVGLVFGAAIAFPSGIGVALSVTGTINNMLDGAKWIRI